MVHLEYVYEFECLSMLHELYSYLSIYKQFERIRRREFLFFIILTLRSISSKCSRSKVDVFIGDTTRELLRELLVDAELKLLIVSPLK